MKKNLLAACILCVSYIGIALEWPANPVIPSRLFGQKNGGVFEKGIALEKSADVRSSNHGEILILIESGNDMNGFPSTLGNALLIAHDDGLVTVYGNLNTVDQIEGKTNIEMGTLLGMPGASGWASPGEILFQVLDAQRKTYLNPLLLLPSLKDAKQPRIRNLLLVSGTGQAIQVSGSQRIRQGKYSLYADIADTIDQSQREMSPFTATVLVNGVTVSTVHFELLKSTGTELYLSEASLTYPIVYKESEALFLGEILFSRGKTDLIITARDASGNEKNLQSTLQVD